MDDAPLPGGSLERLPDRAPQALVGVRGHESDAPDTPGPYGSQEGEPGVVGLGVHDGDAQGVPPAVLVAADGGDYRGGRHAALPPAYTNISDTITGRYRFEGQLGRRRFVPKPEKVSCTNPEAPVMKPESQT